MTTAGMATLFVFLAITSMATCSVRVPRARALMFRAVANGNPTASIGTLDLVDNNGVVMINGSLTGLPAGEHGFHVHEFGDLGNGCLASGGHYNPLRSDHGRPSNPPSARHVGDLGNVMTPGSGPTMINIQDSLIAFTGIRGIVGRAFVIHAGRDDLGVNQNAGSLTTGNAGARLACGVIGYIAPGTS